MTSPTMITQKDTTFTKIFVGGLPYHTTDDTLRKYFEDFGDIEEAVVITDRQSGKSRGYGFVTMSERVAADRATKEPNPVIDGRKANVNLAYLGAKPRQAVGFPAAAYTALAAAAFNSKAYPTAAGMGLSGMGLAPQLMYPSPYLAAAPAASMMTVSQHSPLTSPTAAQQFAAASAFDYSAYASQFSNAFPEAAAYPGMTSLGYLPPGYAYTAIPGAGLGAAGAATVPATYQQQQIPAETRMQ